MGSLGTIAWWLVVLGAVNTGLGALGYNVVDTLLGTQVGQIVYLLVGASGVYCLVTQLGGGKKK